MDEYESGRKLNITQRQKTTNTTLFPLLRKAETCFWLSAGQLFMLGKSMTLFLLGDYVWLGVVYRLNLTRDGLMWNCNV